MAITVPTYDVPDVEPQDPRPAYADYGAGPGRAVEQLGATVSAASDQLANDVRAHQEQQDAVVAQQKYMAAQQKATQALYGDGGILTAQGVNAQGMTQRVIDYLNSTLAEVTQGASPRQQRMIQGMWDRYQVGRVDSAAQREMQAHQQTIADTGQAVITAQRTIAEQDPANERSVVAAADQAADAWQVANPGASPDALTAGRAAARSHVLQGAIISRSYTDPMGAAGMLQNYGPQLYGQDLITTQEHLRPLVQRAQVLQFEKSLTNSPPATARPSDTSPDALWPRMRHQESGDQQFDPKTGGPLTSPAGAVGIAQVQPGTGQEMAGKLGLPWDEARFKTDGTYNEKLGRAYFDSLVGQYGGNTMLAAAAYNAGPGKVDRWLATIGDPRSGEISPQDFAARIPVAETRDYLRKTGAIPAATAPGSGAPGYLAVGDSIGQGLAAAGKIPGPAIKNASPFDTIQQIRALPDAQVAGKTVILSSGASNNPQAVALVDEQIALLKAKGAAEVRLLGVGNRPDFAGLNETLAATASRAGARWMGPIDADSGGVHPKDYARLLNNVQLAGPAVAPAPDGTAPSSPAPPDGAAPSPPAAAAEAAPAAPGAAPGAGADGAAPSSAATVPTLEDLTERARVAAGGDPVLEAQMTAAATRYYSKQLTRQTQAFTQSLAPVDQRANGAPDLDDWLSQAHDRAHGDPILEQRLMAAAQAKYSAWHSQTNAARSDLMRSLPGTQAALEAGADASIPELQIRTYLPAQQAEDTLNNLKISQIAGQAYKSIALAGPDQINATMTDLSSGMGRYAQQIRLHAGRASGPGMVQGGGTAAGDMDGEGDGTAAAGTAQGVYAVTGESPTSFALRRQVLAKFVQLVNQREAVLNGPHADPAAYVAAQDPVVQARLQALQNNPGDAGAQQAYEGALIAQQQALGVKEPRLLSNDQVAEQVKTLTHTDPAQGSTTLALDAMAKQFGDQWPQAFGELVKVGKLDPQYQTLATMTEPSQGQAREDYQRALAIVSSVPGDNKAGMERLKSMPAEEVRQYIDGKKSNIDAVMAPFNATTAFNSGGLNLSLDVKNSIKTLAYYYAARDGLDGNSAIAKAADAIIDQKYEIDGTMRVDRGLMRDNGLTMDQVRAATINTQRNLTGADLLTFQGTTPGLTEADRARTTLGAAHSGFWAPNKDDTGLVLVGRLLNGGWQKMQRPDGSPVQILYSAMPAAAAEPQPASPPQMVRLPTIADPRR
jgi:hypothetical protein